MNSAVHYKWLVSFNEFECNTGVNLATRYIIYVFVKSLRIVKVKYDLIIFYFFLNLGVTLFGIVNNDDIFFWRLVNLDADLKYSSVVDNHDKFLEQLFLYYSFLLNQVAPRNRYLLLWIAPVLCLHKLKHYRHVVHVGSGPETVALVLHVDEGLEGAEAEGELVEVVLVDGLDEVQVVGAILQGAPKLEGQVVIQRTDTRGQQNPEDLIQRETRDHCH